MKRLMLLLLCASLLLASGCSAPPPVTGDSADHTLPPPSLAYTPPYGVLAENLQRETTVILYLPDVTRTRLLPKAITLPLPMGQHGARAVLEELFSDPGDDVVYAPLSPDDTLTLSLVDSFLIEVSRSVATVNLSPSILSLDPYDRFVVYQAIANTLTSFSDIDYVNILVAGRPVSLSTTSRAPMGALSRSSGVDDMLTLWGQVSTRFVQEQDSVETKKLYIPVTLYFPAPYGGGILPEVRQVSFDGQTTEQLVSTLLRELSRGAESLGNTPAMPDLNQLLVEPPRVENLTGHATQKVVLRFREELNTLSAENNIVRSVLMASLSYTLLTFLPENTTYLEVYIGNGETPITQLNPSSYATQREPIFFENALMSRDRFSTFLLGYARLYLPLAGADKLVTVDRPVLYHETKNPEALLRQLMAGVKQDDSRDGTRPIFPEGVGPEDILGIALHEDRLLVNFSENLYEKVFAAISAKEERLLIYAMTNMLCENAAVSAVCYFFGGEQRDSLAEGTYLRGEFTVNPGIVTK